jgi:site-specific recombinase XerD
MSDERDVFEQFGASLAGRDAKTVAAYLSILNGLADWLAGMPGGIPFRVELLTETAVRGYMDGLAEAGRAPRTRSKALTAIRRFSRWAVDEGLLQRDPTRHIERPTVATLAPRELTDAQRYALKNLVEMQGSQRLSAIFALAYWAGMRVGEIAHLQLEHCDVNRRAGVVSVVDAKGGKSRTLDLHNMARRALYAYLYENQGAPDARDPDSRYVFTGQRSAWLRRQGRPDHLSARGIEHLWADLKRRARHDVWELVHDVRFHDLRHDWAHRARAAGWTLEEIAVYAGHQTRDGAPAIATTVRYTLPGRQQIKSLIRDLPG